MAGVFTPGEPALTTFTGSETIPLDTNLANGQYPQSASIALSAFGLGTNGTQVVTAAGATQGNATVINAGVRSVIIAVAATASTHGVILPTAATGVAVRIANNGAFGVKVYPGTNGKIAAAATNANDTTVLAINKANTYIAVSATKWVVERGA